MTFISLEGRRESPSAALTLSIAATSFGSQVVQFTCPGCSRAPFRSSPVLGCPLPFSSLPRSPGILCLEEGTLFQYIITRQLQTILYIHTTHYLLPFDAGYSDQFHLSADDDTIYMCEHLPSSLPSHAPSNIITSSSHAAFALLPVPILNFCDLGLCASDSKDRTGNSKRAQWKGYSY